MTDRNPIPYMALVIHEGAAPSVGRCMSSAASGMPLTSGKTVAETLARLEGAPRVMVVGHEHLNDAVDAVRDMPQTKLAVLTPETTDRLVAKALEVPQIIGLLAWLPAGVRPWELSYVVRRAVAPEQDVPLSSDVLMWGASNVTWHPRTSEERDRTVRAVELVATRFGISRKIAATAADAAHELLVHAMIDAPVDARGRRRYAADRTAQIALEPAEVPTMQLTVDTSHLAIDVTEPFGRLSRRVLLGGILQGRVGNTDVREGIGFFNLFTTAAVLRVEVRPGRSTLVSWMVDRVVSTRDRRAMPRSLYYIEGV